MWRKTPVRMRPGLLPDLVRGGGHAPSPFLKKRTKREIAFKATGKPARAFCHFLVLGVIRVPALF